jgi:hypothetical protein
MAYYKLSAKQKAYRATLLHSKRSQQGKKAARARWRPTEPVRDSVEEITRIDMLRFKKAFALFMKSEEYTQLKMLLNKKYKIQRPYWSNIIWRIFGEGFFAASAFYHAPADNDGIVPSTRIEELDQEMLNRYYPGDAGDIVNSLNQ